MSYTTNLEIQDEIIGKMGLGVDYYKGEPGIPGKDGKDGSDQVYVGADEPTDERVKLWIDTDATPSSGGAADSIDWSKVQNKPNFADVATSGDYNDLSNKPPIPSVEGLASETYVNEKVAAIVIPEVPTKVSELENDKGYLTEHQSLAEYAKKTEIPAPYTLPTASTSTLGGVKVDGNTITIADGVISSVGSTEPDAYIKDASISGNTLTLTKKDDTEVVFTPSGGGSSAVQGYAFTSGKTLTDEDKAHILEIQSNPLIPMYIDGYVVIKKVDVIATGQQLYLVLKYTTSINNHQMIIYKVQVNNGSVSSDKIETYTQRYLPTTNDDITGTILTNTNYSNYINISDWQTTTDLSDSSLYNVREMVFIYYCSDTDTVAQQYYNFLQVPGNTYATLGNDYNNKTFYIYFSDSEFISWYYNGSAIIFSSVPSNNYKYEPLILYKT